MTQVPATRDAFEPGAVLPSNPQDLLTYARQVWLGSNGVNPPLGDPPRDQRHLVRSQVQQLPPGGQWWGQLHGRRWRVDHGVPYRPADRGPQGACDGVLRRADEAPE